MELTPDTAKVAENREVMCRRGILTTIMLLREHSNKLIPNDILLCQ